MNRYSLSTPLDRWGRLQGGPCQKLQCLGFSVGPFRYGIPLLRFAEARNLTGIVPIMRPPDYRCGQAVVYGQPVLLLDLRVELKCPAPFNHDTRVLFAWRRVDSVTESQVGLIVDSVDSVLHIDEEALKSVSEMGNQDQAAHILGVALEGVYRRVLIDLDQWIVE